MNLESWGWLATEAMRPVREALLLAIGTASTPELVRLAAILVLLNLNPPGR